jgi:hypothetical protein
MAKRKVKEQEDKYVYRIRRSKGASDHRSGWNQPLEKIKEVISEHNRFYVILKKIGKRKLKILEVYNGEVIFVKEGHEIK